MSRLKKIAHQSSEANHYLVLLFRLPGAIIRTLIELNPLPEMLQKLEEY